MLKGKLITDDVAADGLLLQSQDAFPFKENLIERCKKYKCVEILDTYAADQSKLDADFVKRLRGENTPQKAMSFKENESGSRVPIAAPVSRNDCYIFTSSDLKMVSDRGVYITREGYLESDAMQCRDA